MTGAGTDLGGRRRLGVLGTLVWDTIHDPDSRTDPSEEWGGIAYSLGALEAALDDGWEIVPLLKVGSDLAEKADEFFSTLPRLRTEAVQFVRQPNNRVELRYIDSERRTERLTGGVPGWTHAELEPLLRSIDALYVNFISGFEMVLATARRVREGFDGPIYADLHSLFLGVTLEGARFDRELADAAEWLQSFNAVQMNETEFDLLGGGEGDPWWLVTAAMGDALKLVAITSGPRGSGFVVSPDFRPDPMTWRATGMERSRPTSANGGERGQVPRMGEAVGADPTGCGDVWGATTFARLLAGDPLEVAMRTANDAASRNAHFKGAGSLYRHLRGHSTVGESAP